MSDYGYKADIEDMELASFGIFGTSERRAHHNALERKRRDQIKDEFSSLKDTIPGAAGEKMSRAAILCKASDFIVEMQQSTSSNENVIVEYGVANVIIEEQVKWLEDAIARGHHPADVGKYLDEARKVALNNYSARTSASKPAKVHTPFGGGGGGGSVAHGNVSSGSTGAGLVLNALATSQGLSQLVPPSSSSANDHTYPCLSPSVQTDRAKQSLTALTAQLKPSKQQPSVQMSSSSSLLAMKRTEPPGTSYMPAAKRTGSVVIRTPAIANGTATRPRGVVMATAVPLSKGHSFSPFVQNAVTSSTAAITRAVSLATPQAPAPEGCQVPPYQPPRLAAEKQQLSTQPEPPKDSQATVIQSLLEASPLELSGILQNILLSADSTHPIVLSDSQKVMLTTLAELTCTVQPTEEPASEPAPAHFNEDNPAAPTNEDNPVVRWESPPPTGNQEEEELPTGEILSPSKFLT